MLVRHENRVKLVFCAFFIVISFSHLSYSQVFKTTNPSFRPPVIDNVAQYKNSIRQDSTKRLVLLQSFVPQLVIDLAYATRDNFVHQVLYQDAKAYALLPVAQALKKISLELVQKGVGLKVFDAYRPYSVTKKMWKVVPDERYAANPAKGSGHNRGAAVDVTLVKLSTGKELLMPTGFDDFSERAHHDFRDLPRKVLDNRQLLKETMVAYGFVPLSTEWWHYSLPDASRFDLLDISFSQLDK
jgi:D-alanyl-D-alanine dipeptidase